jgi:hypothetical protein
MDKDRLAKLLSLSQSDNDAESLSAIRKANSMLKKEGLTWQQVLGGTQATIRSRQTTGFNMDDVMMDDVIREWSRAMEEAMQGMKPKPPPGQSMNPTHARVRDMIVACMAKNYSTAKMITILDKIKRDEPITHAEEQYVRAIFDVVCKT